MALMRSNDHSAKSGLGRRSFLALAAAAPALAQTQRDWTNRQPVRYPDPDVVALDKSFAKYQLFNAVHLPALRRDEMGGRSRLVRAGTLPGLERHSQQPPVALPRRGRARHHLPQPSGYSNGNTFDFEGRQLSCEHAGRRVARYEHNGTVTTIADKYNGKPLNSPNDVVVHPDGSIWFTDPPYGILGNYEGNQAKPELKEAVYRVDREDGQDRNGDRRAR